jgi:dTMP kinase
MSSQPAATVPFFAFEGADGCGKDLQTKLTLQAFRAAQLPVITTRDLGGTETGQRIRNIIIDSELAVRDGEIDPLTSAYLLMADRRHNIQQNILPALQQGQAVICNRYCISTIAFQGYGLGGNLEDLTRLTMQAISLNGAPPLLANLWFILNVSPEVGLARKGQQANHTLDRIELKGTAFQQRVANGYLEIAQNLSPINQRCIIIDANQPAATVHQHIIQHLNQRFNLTLQPVI